MLEFWPADSSEMPTVIGDWGLSAGQANFDVCGLVRQSLKQSHCNVWRSNMGQCTVSIAVRATQLKQKF